jgi:hypothetical protein
VPAHDGLLAHTVHMGKEATKWLEAVDPHFGFLADLGFAPRAVDDSSFWSVWVQYQSSTSAVRISKSNEFVRSEVHLIPLGERRGAAVSDLDHRRPDRLDAARQRHRVESPTSLARSASKPG